MTTKKTNNSGGGKKETGNKMSVLASKALRGEKLSPAQVKSLGASVLSQDETKGKRK